METLKNKTAERGKETVFSCEERWWGEGERGEESDEHNRSPDTYLPGPASG